ncbi:PEP/pyruvate-binding domain-containing protein [Geodermatophilus sp. CPCC 206100]|uniref:PEP/pyruvate-binding domain-containing protein n=1 Tax=Geodermatophilus sp. CPCC 206100 TaxID=3020054 RepID=UPI003B008378
MTPGWLPLSAVEDEHAYGGKAAALGTATRAGLPVPPGVALSADLVAFATRDECAADAAGAVRAAARHVPGPLAVRSSVVGEDGARNSFAGQHVTVLNVVPPDGVVRAVRQVAASACAPSALAYRRARGDHSAPRCGVVLHRLVTPVVAGALFSRHPVSGADELVVEAGWGLGAAVVEGLVVPDRFRLSPDGRLLEQVLGDKDRAVVPQPGGGTTVVEVPAAQAGRPCLGPGQLGALAELARRCDEVFGGPSDLEWAWTADGPVLLQRRPVPAPPR